MHTLSIRCQNAYLVCLGVKDIENRTWKTEHRGELLIHSSGKGQNEIDVLELPKELQVELKQGRSKFRYREKLDNFYKTLYKYYGSKNPDEWGNRTFLKSQAIIGKVNLVDIIQDSKSAWAKKNQYHWVLENAELFETPILFIKGRLKLFNYEMR